jgi:microcystin-dependent protein
MLRNYTNVASPVALTAGVASNTLVLQVPSTAGYPVPPFTVGIDRGTAREEVCLCTGLTSNSFTVTRGYDGTTAQVHDLGASVEHCVSAEDYAEANAHVNSPHAGLTTPSPFIPGDFKVSSVPSQAGWVLCDGAAYSRTNFVYSALFAAIGTSFGPGDGSTTFNVPDSRGRTLVGVGLGPGLTNRVLGAAGGAESHAIATAEMPNHTHGISDPGHSHGVGNDSPDHGHNHGHSMGTDNANHTHGIGGMNLVGASAHDHDAVGNLSTGTQQANAGNMFIQTGGESNNHTHQCFSDATGANARHSHSLGSSGAGLSLGAVGGNSAISLVQPFVAAYLLIKL